MKTYVPTKQLKARFSLSWVDEEVGYLMRKREQHRTLTKHHRFAPKCVQSSES